MVMECRVHGEGGRCLYEREERKKTLPGPSNKGLKGASASKSFLTAPALALSAPQDPQHQNSGQPPFRCGKTEAQTGAATCPGAGSTSDTASPSPSHPPGSGWKNTWLSSTCMPHAACKPILGGPQPGAGGVRRGGGAPKKWGEADAFPPKCCSRLLPLPGTWNSASLSNHLLFFSHLEPLSGDPLPQLLCPGPAAQLFPGWWFGPGWPVPTTLSSA